MTTASTVDLHPHGKGHPHHPQALPLGSLVASPIAQRQFIPSWADALASKFDLDDMGRVAVNKRGTAYYIIDGQHRVAALKLLGFASEDLIPCEVYEGLSEEAEAEVFLRLNFSKPIGAYDRFDKAVKANRSPEVQIAQVVRAQGLHIAGHRGEGCISAVAALRRGWDRLGAIRLGACLRILRDAYGSVGFDSAVIDGLSLFLHRYGDLVNEDQMIDRLSKTTGGLNGLIQPAKRAHIALGQQLVQCIAAQLTTIYNRDQRGKKLATWWKE